MTIFVTGATGYIGKEVATTLHYNGYRVLALARSEEAADALHELGYEVLQGDLADPDILRKGADAAGGIIHAGISSGEDAESIDERAVDVFLDAISGTQKPFVYTSGVWVLGRTDGQGKHEDGRLDPTPLIAWRAGAERRILSAETPGIVLRPGIVHGRGGGIPGMLLDWARDDGRPRLVRGADIHWPFVHVLDLAELYVRALDAPAGSILHGVSEPGVELRDVARAIARAASLPSVEGDEDIVIQPVEEARSELGDFADALALDQVVHADATRNLLGWEATHEGVVEDISSGSYTFSGSDLPICTTCGTEFPAGDPPPVCPICDDERQYVGWGGQEWTTMKRLSADHGNHVGIVEPGLDELWTEPSIGIGQRALLVRTDEGNVLWECLTLIDDETVRAVENLGGLAAIAISHPHYYSAAVSWSRAFGDVPVYVHERDRAWVMRPDDAFEFWSGETQQLPGGLTLVRVGGHFPGSSVLIWPEGARGRGALLAGDSIKVSLDRRFVSFMHSFPNHVPLSEESVDQIVRAVEPFEFDRIYGAWRGHVMRSGGKEAVKASADRYIAAIGNRVVTSTGW